MYYVGPKLRITRCIGECAASATDSGVMCETEDARVWLDAQPSERLEGIRQGDSIFLTKPPSLFGELF